MSEVTTTELAPAEIKRPTTITQAAQAGDRVPMMSFGGSFLIQPQSVGELVEMAKLMSSAGPMVGKNMRGNVGACLAIILQAGRCNMDPFALSLKTYMVNDQIAYESQAVAAMIYASPVLDGRLNYTFTGEGETLTCKVTGRIKGVTGELEYTSPPKGSIKTQNSPLWKSDPQQQLGYYSARAWARRHVPDVIMGVYTTEEIEATPSGFVNVTPDKSDPVARLTQNLAAAKPAEPAADPAPKSAEPEPAAETVAETVTEQAAQEPAAPVEGEVIEGDMIEDTPADLERLKDIVDAQPARIAPSPPSRMLKANAKPRDAEAWAKDFAGWYARLTKAERTELAPAFDKAADQACGLSTLAADTINAAINSPAADEDV